MSCAVGRFEDGEEGWPISGSLFCLGEEAGCAFCAMVRMIKAVRARKMASIAWVMTAMWTVRYDLICLGKVWGCVSTRSWSK